jgi:hypothetical protein
MRGPRQSTRRIPVVVRRESYLVSSPRARLDLDTAPSSGVREIGMPSTMFTAYLLLHVSKIHEPAEEDQLQDHRPPPSRTRRTPYTPVSRPIANPPLVSLATTLSGPLSALPDFSKIRARCGVRSTSATGRGRVRNWFGKFGVVDRDVLLHVFYLEDRGASRLRERYSKRNL